jgi:hypothetical protein
MVMVKVCDALVSTPPSKVPPLSWATTVIVAEPTALAAGVNVSCPVELMVGCTLNNNGSELLATTKLTLWPDSLAGPGETLVAQAGKLWRPELKGTVRSLPFTKLGTSLTGWTVTLNVRVVHKSSALSNTPSNPASRTVTVTVPAP